MHVLSCSECATNTIPLCYCNFPTKQGAASNAPSFSWMEVKGRGSLRVISGGELVTWGGWRKFEEQTATWDWLKTFAKRASMQWRRRIKRSNFVVARRDVTPSANVATSTCARMCEQVVTSRGHMSRLVGLVPRSVPNVTRKLWGSFWPRNHSCSSKCAYVMHRTHSGSRFTHIHQ